MSETITQTPGAPGTAAATGLPVDGVNPANLTQTPAQAAAPTPTSLVTDAAKAAAAPTSLVTDTVKADTDPAKNPDGTPKTAEQIAADVKAEADKKAANVVPEKYELKIGDKPADAAQVEAFTPIAKELGLSQEAAQKLVDFHASQIMAQAKTQTEAWTALNTKWQTEARADPEYGNGAGGKTFEENSSLIAKGLSTFGTPKLNEALIASGMGNHPEIARFLYRVGKAVSEDSIRVGGGVGTSGNPSPFANRLFPTMKA